MMNLEDDEVDGTWFGLLPRKLLTSHKVASRHRESKMQTTSDLDPPDSDVEDQDEDVEMDAASDWGNMQEEEDEPVVQRKRMPKKKWPVGQNGLKKKRIVKTRVTQDKKGYDGAERFTFHYGRMFTLAQ